MNYDATGIYLYRDYWLIVETWTSEFHTEFIYNCIVCVGDYCIIIEDETLTKKSWWTIRYRYLIYPRKLPSYHWITYNMPVCV